MDWKLILPPDKLQLIQTPTKKKKFEVENVYLFNKKKSKNVIKLITIFSDS